MKLCSTCGEYKPLEQFSKRRKDGETRRSYCKPCGKVQSKASRDKIRGEMRAWLDELKSQPCTDCGVNYPPYVMEWDHVRGIKNFGIADAIWSSPSRKQSILDEISLCELVCANCHRVRTHNRHKPKERQ